MVNGINGNSMLNWYQLLNSTQKKTATGTNSTGSADSAEISGIPLGSQGTERQNPLERLVNDGTITNDQASAIHDALRSAMESGQGPDSGNDPLASLVSAGTITQDQADSVKSVLEANKPGRDGQDFMSGVLDSLVSAGTITQNQADSVKQSLSSRGPQGMPPPPPPEDSSSSGASSSSSSSSSADLSSLTADEILQLLASGKISAKDAEGALKKLEEKAESNAAKTGTSATGSATATGASSGAGRSNPLDSLVSSGVISQDQEDAIRSAFQQAMETRRAVAAYSAGSSNNAGIQI